MASQVKRRITGFTLTEDRKVQVEVEVKTDGRHHYSFAVVELDGTMTCKYKSSTGLPVEEAEVVYLGRTLRVIKMGTDEAFRVYG